MLILNLFYLHRVMATPPRSPPHSSDPSKCMFMSSRQFTWLGSLTVRDLVQPRPIVNVNPTTGRGLSPHKEKFHSYLGKYRQHYPFLLQYQSFNGRLSLQCCFLLRIKHKSLRFCYYYWIMISFSLHLLLCICCYINCLYA